MNDLGDIEGELRKAVLMMEVRRASISAIANGGSVVSDSDGVRVDCGRASSELVSRRISSQVKSVMVDRISDKILNVRFASRRV